MRPARSRRVQAQRKFAQGAYVPPSVCAVVAAENRREVTQDARNVTINHMTASRLLDVVSLQSLHSHLNSQPVVLIERLRGRNQARDVPTPPSPPETAEKPKSSIKKPAEPPKLHVIRKKQEYKRVHAMSLRSRRLSKLELNKLVAQGSAPVRRIPSKRRRRNSSDEDEPLIFQKTRKKSTGVAVESNPKNKSTKSKPPKNVDNCDLRSRKTTTKENKTNSISSRLTKKSSAKKKAPVKEAPQKRVLNESIPKPPKEFTVTVVKKLTNEQLAPLENNAPLDNLVTQDDSSDIAVGPDVSLSPVDPVALSVPVTTEKPVVEPVPVKNKPVDAEKPDSINLFPVMFSDESSETDEVLGALDDLSVFDSLLEVSDDEPTGLDEQIKEIREEVVSLLQNNEADHNKDEHSSDSTPDDLPHLRYESDDEPMMQDSPAVEQKQGEAVPTIQSDQNANPPSVSPEPGPSGTQRINNPYSDQYNDEDDRSLQSFLKNIFENRVSFTIQTSPKNAPTKQLDSHCKGIKPSSRIKVLETKIIRKANSSFPPASQPPSQDVRTADPENELERGQGETEDDEISNENQTVAEDKDDGYLRFNVPSPYELSNVTMKVRENKIYGKSILVVNCEKTGESSKDTQELSQLEGKEHVLDKLIDTLNISRNVNPEGRNVSSEAGNVKSESQDVNSESQDVNSESQNDNPDDRSIDMSATSNTPEQEKSHRIRSDKKKISYQKVVATRRRLAEAKVMQDRIRQVKERDILRIELQKQKEISQMVEKSDSVVNKEQEYARLKVKIMENLQDEMQDDLRMFDEVDTLAKRIEKEKDVNKYKSPPEDGTLVDAPVYHPSEEEFQDPITFYEKIYEETKEYGICKVVPPPGWKPPSEVHDDLKFDVMNQYISRLFNRWGPAARELSAIKLCLQQQNISFARPPHVDGVEINLPKLYHLVQRLGGLESVINKKRWSKVADDLRIAKGGGNERKLDQIYMKFLLPYDTLSHQERQEIMRKVELAWNKKNQKLLDRAMNPLYRQKRMLDLMDSSDDETEDEDTKAALKHAEDCIIKGQVMIHNRFKKVASSMFESVIGPNSEATPPDPEHIEKLYWGIVNSGTDHVCVHTAAVDTGIEGHGFSTKVEPYARHPWNPKRVIYNPRNVLRYLGSVVGVTLPTLLLGMIFSTSCWHKDPHAVAWYEFQCLGPTRIWYGIPEDQADDFRMAVETLSPTSCQNKSLWLSSEITMIPPSVLRDHNVRLSRVTQDKGEFILAFPNAYACSISTGYTESESVYFAPPTWLDCLWKVFKEARESCEPTMFSMEHLLYNIGRDKKPVLEILEHAQPLYDKMLREEVTNRQMLQERGLSLVSELLSAQVGAELTEQKPQEECDYCRASLFLSKVKGLIAKNSVLCLEHTLTLLDSDKYRETDVKQLQFLVHVTVKELNKVHDDMKRHLRIKT